LGLLIFYSLALIVGAIPDDLATKDVRSVAKALRRMFWIAHVRPAATVFEGERKYARAVHHWCLVVLADDEAGSQHVLHEDFPRCAVPRVRLFNDLWRLALMASMDREIAGRLGLHGDHEKQVRHFETSARLDAISRYFCTQGPDDRTLTSVYLASRTLVRKYADDRVSRRDDVLHRYDCTKDRRRAARRVVFEITDDGPRVRPRTPEERARAQAPAVKARERR
jgi:hypothetical protein